MVCANSNRISRVPPYSGVHSLRFAFRVQDFHSLRFTFPGNSTMSRFVFYESYNPDLWSVWALSLSLAATQEIDVSFSSSGYLDVSVHRVPSLTLCIHVKVLEVFSSGSPHSEIDGSFRICRSPSLIAAYHVFLRLLVPRHPPYALIV